MGYKSNGKDRIFRIRKNNSNIEGELLHRGDLNFHIDSPIESINFFENNNIKKIYWIDSRNQPRIVNIADPKFNEWSDLHFDFVPNLNLKENVIITKNLTGNGVFHSGIIQYAFTYYNIYGQESNIFYTSSIYNISPKNRASSPEENSNCSFKIQLTNLDTQFDYLRIYSISRTSINSTPIVRKVADIQIPTIQNNTSDIIYIDNGLQGEIIDATSLLYIGGEEIIAETFTQKDNTLFLGNIKLKRPTVGNLNISKKNNTNTTISVYDLLKQHTGVTSGDIGNYASSFIELSSKDLMEDNSTNLHYSYNPDSLSNLNKFSSTLKSENFKTLKTNEVYRLGVQFQHVSGKWSEPIFINDKLIDILNNTEPIIVNNQVTNVIYHGVKASMYLHDNNYNLIKTLVDNNYVKVRAVIVYPNAYERLVVAQGVVNPTLYSTSDRISGTPHNISSWFFRPMINDTLIYKDTSVLTDSNYLTDPLLYPQTEGTIAEFRHNFALPSGRTSSTTSLNTGYYKRATAPNGGLVIADLFGYVNQEISSLYSYWLRDCYLTSDDVSNNLFHNMLAQIPTQSEFLKYYRDNFYVDQNVVTFHSPDVEFDESLKGIYNENLICKIVGFVNLTGFSGKKFVSTTGPTWHYSAQGVIPENINQPNYNNKGGNLLISYPLYRDCVAGVNSSSPSFTNYVIYPWDAMDKSLIGDPVAENRSVLDYNKTSNLRYSSYNSYLTVPEPILLTDNTNGITPVQLYNSNQTDIVKVKFKNDNINQITYQGNVDKLVITSASVNTKGYPIMTTEKSINSTSVGGIWINNHYRQAWGDGNFQDIGPEVFDWKKQPVNIKYNTTPHLVFGFEYEEDSNGTLIQNILPNLGGKNSQNNINGTPFWKPNKQFHIRQKAISTTRLPNRLDHSGLWLVELQRNPDDINGRFGDGPNGATQESLENLKWLPCGEPVSLVDNSNNPLSTVLVEWTEGDTYLQRYDCLKTYGSDSDKQSVTEILSFVCESRTNMDGRYDKNRGNLDNTSANPTKFNLINPVYTQQNNFFTYRSLNYDKFNLDNFPNTVTWSKTKSAGELIDAWTNITMASTIDVNGSFGNIQSLQNYNSSLLGFQDKGIFNINFNSRVQVQSSDGIPIELTNNYKVDGFRYISTNLGIVNKWSINSNSQKGLYFIDDISKALYILNDGFTNLSDNLGFHSWFVNNININDKWKSLNSSNFITSYDKIHDYLYITNKDYSLGYSELLNNFGSFFSYNNVPYMFNIWDKFISINKDKTKANYPIDNTFNLWENYSGDYNNFYNKIEPYHITYVINPEFTTDKIFEILEFRADSFNTDNTVSTNPLFNKLSVWNEYQHGESKLLNTTTYLPTSELRGRFRMWRVNIPRVVNIDNTNINPISHTQYNTNRMRGTNMFLKLESDGIVNKKNTLHDIIVYYR